MGTLDMVVENFLPGVFQLTIVKNIVLFMQLKLQKLGEIKEVNLNFMATQEISCHCCKQRWYIPFPKCCIFTNPDIDTTIFDLNDDANTDEAADDDQIDKPAFSLNQDTVFELVDQGTFV